MSWDTEQWARKQRAGDPVRKAILVAVANEADTSGCNAFPSVKFLAYECEVSVRTVQRRLQELEDMGLLRRVTRWRPDGSQSSNGFDLIGYEPPFQFKEDKARRRPGANLSPPPAKLAPQDDVGDRGGGDNGDTPKTLDELPFPPSPDESGESPPKGGEPPDCNCTQDQLATGEHHELCRFSWRQDVQEEPKSRRGSRLPEDWTPPPLDTLPQTVQAVVKQWPAGAYEFVAAGFTSHWTAESGRKASKQDWTAAWVKWLTSEGPRVMHLAKAGISFGSGVEIATKAQCEEVERLQASEHQRATTLRQLVRKDVGDKAYDGWLKPTAIAIDQDGGGWSVNVVCPSPFVRDWVRQHFGATILALAKKLLAASGHVQTSFEAVGDR